MSVKILELTTNNTRELAGRSLQFDTRYYSFSPLPRIVEPRKILPNPGAGHRPRRVFDRATCSPLLPISPSYLYAHHRGTHRVNCAAYAQPSIAATVLNAATNSLREAEITPSGVPIHNR